MNISKKQKQKREKQIIQTIQQKKAATATELAQIFKVKHSQMTKWLRKLCIEGKIQKIRIAGRGHSPSIRLFPNYTGRNIYYKNKQDLAEWIKQQLPPHIPQNMKKAITHKLHKLLKIQLFPKPKTKTITLPPEIHTKLKQIAEKQNLSLTQLIEKNITEGDKYDNN